MQNIISPDSSSLVMRSKGEHPRFNRKVTLPITGTEIWIPSDSDCLPIIKNFIDPGIKEGRVYSVYAASEEVGHDIFLFKGTLKKIRGAAVPLVCHVMFDSDRSFYSDNYALGYLLKAES